MEKNVKTTLLTITVAALLSAAQPTVADEMQARIADSRSAIKEFATTLKGKLKAAMKAGGPVNAIDVCHKVAPAIARAESEKRGWEVGRTSLKNRSPYNAPNDWERAVLEQFEQRLAEGEPAAKIDYAEMVEADGKREFRYMKAIPTGKVCLKCHGTNLQPEVAAKLDALYPDDMARGFKLGDIRGAFVVVQPM